MGVDNYNLKGKAARFYREAGMRAYYEHERLTKAIIKKRKAKFKVRGLPDARLTQFN